MPPPDQGRSPLREITTKPLPRKRSAPHAALTSRRPPQAARKPAQIGNFNRPDPNGSVDPGLAVNVGPAAATVWGTVDDKGEVATYRFDHGTSTNYTSQTISEPVSDSSSTPTSVDARLTGLSPNTVYHYRIEATDAWGTTYGADQTFTTTG